MLKSHLLLALRNLRRRPAYTVINVLGLAVGMAVCVLIGLYAHDELSFDRFHERADRIVQLGAETEFSGRMTATPYPLAPALEAALPTVERAVRTITRSVKVGRDAPRLEHEETALLADPGFFEVFTFPLVRGDPAAVLAAPDAVVLTESTARAHFGEADPVGQTLQVSVSDTVRVLTVRGVAADPPAASTIQFDLVAPMDLLSERYRPEDGWGMYMFGTYALLTEPMPEQALNEAVARAVRPHFEADEPPAFFAVALPSLYLSDLYVTEGFRGQRRYLYLFGSAALLVLLIAAINYVNLATVQGARRAREIGVRKALGAGRHVLARQFLTESVLLSVLALGVGLVLVVLALPAFDALFSKELTMAPGARGGVLLGLAAFVLGVGLAAGAYPALVLSRFDPVRVLRGQSRTTAGGSGFLRKGLVVLQFAISTVLILGTAVIYHQLHFMQTKSLGFDGEQVVLVDLPDEAWRLRDAFQRDVVAHSGVLQATVASAVPGGFHISLVFPPEDVSTQAQTDEEAVFFQPAVVDSDFVETLGLRLIAGRDFSGERPSDEARAYVINEAAARRMGWTPEEAVGKPFSLNRQDGPEGEIIGVVEDFHTASLHEEIAPVVLQLRESESWSSRGVLAARLAPGDIREGLRHIEQAVARLAPSEPFAYRFLDDTFHEMYASEEQLSRIFLAFAGLAVFIACLGLFGLAAFTAQQRTKEIGIRKVLGASVPGLVALLSKDFLTLVGVAFVIAVPLAYVAMSRWLEDFAYRVELGPGVFLLAGAAALMIALLTVSVQAVRAARADPVQSLRYE